MVVMEGITVGPKKKNTPGRFEAVRSCSGMNSNLTPKGSTTFKKEKPLESNVLFHFSTMVLYHYFILNC